MVSTIEYNGEMLTITAIAQKENLPKTSLDRRYKQTGNIYEAVSICKENLIKKIEYNGEFLPLKTIAKKEGIAPDSLRKTFKQTGDIYEAVKTCKENQAKHSGDIEYNGEKLTLAAIAKKEGISKETLYRRYKETGDIYESVKICKQQEKTDNTIEYNGKKLALEAIAKMEGIPRTSLDRRYKQTGDIYEAIRAWRENQDNKKIGYNRRNVNYIRNS